MSLNFLSYLMNAYLQRIRISSPLILIIVLADVYAYAGPFMQAAIRRAVKQPQYSANLRQGLCLCSQILRFRSFR